MKGKKKSQKESQPDFTEKKKNLKKVAEELEAKKIEFGNLILQGMREIKWSSKQAWALFSTADQVYEKTLTEQPLDKEEEDTYYSTNSFRYDYGYEPKSVQPNAGADEEVKGLLKAAKENSAADEKAYNKLKKKMR